MLLLYVLRGGSKCVFRDIIIIHLYFYFHQQGISSEKVEGKNAASVIFRAKVRYFLGKKGRNNNTANTARSVRFQSEGLHIEN
jgi:hypothetical protein